MATKINGSSKRQEMNNKPIMESFHTNSYNNKNNYQRIKPPQNHSSQLKNIPIPKSVTLWILDHPLFCHPIHILPQKLYYACVTKMLTEPKNVQRTQITNGQTLQRLVSWTFKKFFVCCFVAIKDLIKLYK